MCGIVGTSWSKKAREFIIGGLEKLEYRGMIAQVFII